MDKEASATIAKKGRKKEQEVTCRRTIIKVPKLNQKLNGPDSKKFAQTNDEFGKFLDWSSLLLFAFYIVILKLGNYVCINQTNKLQTFI